MLHHFHLLALGDRQALQHHLFHPFPSVCGGRDLRKEWGAVPVIAASQKCISPANKMMAKMGHQGNKSLSTNLQGPELPVETLIKHGRSGIGDESNLEHGGGAHWHLSTYSCTAHSMKNYRTEMGFSMAPNSGIVKALINISRRAATIWLPQAAC